MRFWKKGLALAMGCGLLLGGCGQPADLSAAVATGAVQAAETVTAHIDSQHDNYFYYYSPEDYELMIEEYQGSFGGIGVSMVLNDSNEVEIYAVIPDSPAAATSIAAGEVIIAVDGESIEGYDTTMAVSLIRGEIGTPVTVTMLRPDGSQYDVTLVRDTIVTTSVEGQVLADFPSCGYIYISEFNAQTPSQFLSLYNMMNSSLKGMKHLIIDLRSDGGGNLSAAIEIAGYFIPNGELVMAEKTVDGLRNYKSNDGSLNGQDILILINQYSASASEVLAGALLDQCDATLIGVTSFGKGITQNVELLRSGSALKYTRSLYYTPSGFSLHGMGLEPAVSVEMPENFTREEYWSRDPAISPFMKAALNSIQGE